MASTLVGPPTMHHACHSSCCRDKRVVKEPASEADIWWGPGSPNFEMDEQ